MSSFPELAAGPGKVFDLDQPAPGQTAIDGAADFEIIPAGFADRDRLDFVDAAGRPDDLLAGGVQ